ncbi:ATP-binding protein [Nonomuraea sp. NPDC052129]|uniref:ATP-binding protein n=1 Tax=Nonomuraea sp. NPDC052129 TaxID=3154651 RepID=UPI003429707E
MKNPSLVPPASVWDDKNSCEVRWDLPADPEAVGVARQLVREALAGWGLSALAEDVAMVVSEVATNVVVHARSPMTLSLRRYGRSVRGEVADRSAGWPTPLPVGLDEEHGRGLAIVAAYADRWGVDSAPQGKTVWFVCGEREVS